MTYYFSVKNGLALKEKIDELTAQGVSRESIILISHQKERAKELAEALNISKMGPTEHGYIKSFRNIFLSREEEIKNIFIHLI
ncbi:general stress protein [Kurthia senegalensis]|uniref:general stress protein n=1 Tax=Kurthia senegalensis TaxID=1033740 RepID=UPI000287EE19|nr:general stress protein [Kurthia senegalensis]